MGSFKGSYSWDRSGDCNTLEVIVGLFRVIVMRGSVIKGSFRGYREVWEVIVGSFRGIVMRGSVITGSFRGYCEVWEVIVRSQS